jgi:hypothetical protein
MGHYPERPSIYYGPCIEKQSFLSVNKSIENIAY